MNIVTCVARVPDTATKIRVAADGKSIDAEGVQFVINPYDEFALEEALRFKEAQGGDLTVFHVGAVDFQKDLRQCLAKGADRAVQVQVDGPTGPQTTARLLAERIRPLMPAVIFCGKQSVDSDVGGTGIMLGAILGIPVVSKISSFSYQGERARCRREVEGGIETIETALPCVFTCEKGLNEPRRAGLKEIVAAKKKPLDVETVAATPPKLAIRSLELPDERTPGRILGQGLEAVPILVDVLRREAKVL